MLCNVIINGHISYYCNAITAQSYDQCHHHHPQHPLSCRYAWYRILGDRVLTNGTFQNLTFPLVRAHHAGQYYCKAWSRLGYQTSPVVTLTVLCK